MAGFEQNHMNFLLVDFASYLAEDLPVTSSCPLLDLRISRRVSVLTDQKQGCEIETINVAHDALRGGR